MKREQSRFIFVSFTPGQRENVLFGSRCGSIKNLTDIVGGVLPSGGMVMHYKTVCGFAFRNQHRTAVGD